MVKKTAASKRGTGRRLVEGGRKPPKKAAARKPSSSVPPRLSGGALTSRAAPVRKPPPPEHGESVRAETFAQLRGGRGSIVIFAREYREACDFAAGVRLDKRDWYFPSEFRDLASLLPPDVVVVNLSGWYLAREHRTVADNMRWDAYKMLMQAFQGYGLEREYHMIGDTEICIGKKK